MNKANRDLFICGFSGNDVTIGFFILASDNGTKMTYFNINSKPQYTSGGYQLISGDHCPKAFKNSSFFLLDTSTVDWSDITTYPPSPFTYFKMKFKLMI